MVTLSANRSLLNLFNDLIRTSEDGVLSFGERYKIREDPDKGMFEYASEWTKTRELDEEALKEDDDESEEVYRPGSHNEMRERRVGVFEVFEDDNSSDEEEGDVDEPATTRRILVNVTPTLAPILVLSHPFLSILSTNLTASKAIPLEAPEDNTDEHDPDLTTIVTAAWVPADDDMRNASRAGGNALHGSA
ncbi:hypothetical protein BDN72DRAFT_905266 [Pluteus cervinus]|uniref:Uncharacterized protein n=1 Tax=Pluteus cervinus TaxID=181527 RepID=A0ACD3A3E1_9AGAR|nr:hypothetical protein BDN72DRAFT_905266 [Pluteus cervinus]